jgi:DNA-binding CsgD family transcriptional regulator
MDDAGVQPWTRPMAHGVGHSMIHRLRLPRLIWLAQEQACATDLVADTLQRALRGSVTDALSWAAKTLGFDSYMFGIVAHDRRPDGGSPAYVVTDQSEQWIREYDEGAYIEVDPRVDLAQEPGYAFWEAREFDRNPRSKAFLTDAAAHGIQSGLVLGLCTRDPPLYAMMAFDCSAPTLDRWGRNERLMTAGQAQVIAKVLSRSMRKYLDDSELLFPVRSMRLSLEEREILTLAAAGRTSKEIAMQLEIAKVTVDMRMRAIIAKMRAVNRNQAIVKAITNKLIQLPAEDASQRRNAKPQDARTGLDLGKREASAERRQGSGIRLSSGRVGQSQGSEDASQP